MPSARPERPRFVYLPHAIPTNAIDAHVVRVDLRDERKGIQPAASKRPALARALPGKGRVEVPLPDEYLAAIRKRAAAIPSGNGEDLSLDVSVRSCFVEERSGTKRVEVHLRAKLLGENGDVVAHGSSSGYEELLGPPHDDAELRDLHRAAALDAFDALLINVFTAEELNPILRSRSRPAK